MILNLTQHIASQAQEVDGVIEPSTKNKKKIVELITFSSIADTSAIEQATRIKSLISIIREEGCLSIMIGGAPFFMSALELTLVSEGFYPLYAFSQRVSEEIDGVKTSKFKHLGFIESKLYDTYEDMCQQANGNVSIKLA